MNKWLSRFKESASSTTDTADTLPSMSIPSVPITPTSQNSAPTMSTVSVADGQDFEKYQEVYHERAGIMQHDSGWSLDEANHWGLREAVFAWVRDHHPYVITQITETQLSH
jgi:hypothetical protein